MFLRKLLPLLFIWIIATNPLIAQEKTSVEKSRKTEIINGQEFFIHTVKKGQTLYSIAKAYDVTMDELLRENPEAKDGIKVYQKIRIPIKKAEENPAPKPWEKPDELGTHNEDSTAVFTEYTVKKGETLYSISKKFSVKIEDLMSNNPDLKDGLKTNMVIRVPVKAKAKKTEKVSTISGAARSQKRTDTLSGAGKPELKPLKTKEVYNVALMLPFYLDQVDSINTEKTDEPATTVPSFRFIQFQEGFNMALDSMVKHGLSVKLFVYDVDEDSLLTKKILKKPEMAGMDLIIGPVYGSSFGTVANFARKNEIRVVNPFSARSDILRNNPFVFKAVPARSTSVQTAGTYIDKTFSPVNLLIVNNNKEKEKRTSEMVKTEMETILKNAPEKGNTLKVIAFDPATIPQHLSKTKANVLFTVTNDQAFVLDYIRNLNNLRDEYNIILFGLPGWEEFENLQLQMLEALKYHQYAYNFIDYDKPAVRNFVRAFRDLYHTDPEDYAFQGYDLGYYFLGALLKFGKEFETHLSGFQPGLLEAGYKFSSSGNNGYENQVVSIFKLENYKKVLVAIPDKSE